MRDIVAYIARLSKGVPVGEKVDGSGIKYLSIKDKSDSVAGKSLYSAKCAATAPMVRANLIAPDMFSTRRSGGDSLLMTEPA